MSPPSRLNPYLERFNRQSSRAKPAHELFPTRWQACHADRLMPSTLRVLRFATALRVTTAALHGRLKASGRGTSKAALRAEFDRLRRIEQGTDLWGKTTYSCFVLRLHQLN